MTIEKRKIGGDTIYHSVFNNSIIHPIEENS
jgi:hypothetical protein